MLIANWRMLDKTLKAVASCSSVLNNARLALIFESRSGADSLIEPFDYGLRTPSEPNQDRDRQNNKAEEQQTGYPRAAKV